VREVVDRIAVEPIRGYLDRALEARLGTDSKETR